jgi:hypothetical protein
MANKAGRPKTPKDKARAPGISIRLTQAESEAISTAINSSPVKRRTEWARKALLYVAANGIRIT